MTEPSEWQRLYEDGTTDELQRLREKFLTQLTERESSWGGLLAAMGAVFLPVSPFSAILLVVGLPAVWFWHKDDRQRWSLDNAYKAVVAEHERRGQT